MSFSFQHVQPKQSLGNVFAQGVEQGIQPVIQAQTQRGILERGLSGLDKLGPNATPYDLAKALIVGTAGTQDQGKVISTLYPLLLQQMQAKQSGAVKHPREGEGQFDTSIPKGKGLPRFGQTGENPLPTDQKNQFFPTAKGGNQPPGNAYQSDLPPGKLPILSPQDEVAQGRKRFDDLNAQGKPTTLEQSIADVRAENQVYKDYNKQIDTDRQERVSSQEKYGGIAEDSLKKVLPEATPEQLAIAKKWGEEEAGKNMSEADIKRTLDKKSTKLSNDIDNVRQKISAPRLQNSLSRRALGSYKDFEQAAGDLRLELKPLLDLGLYDTARNLLEETGYAPEEREIIINPLNERTVNTLNQVPKAKIEKMSAPTFGISTPIPSGVAGRYNEGQQKNVEDGIKNVFQHNPNASIVLLRKSFEDKGYDWQIYKKALNKLATETSENGGIDLTDDQFNQLIYLDQPPLNHLQELLHGLHLIGR